METKEENDDFNKIKLTDKYNIKFHFICQLFDNCLKAKTKAKIKYYYNNF
jgi:hypothetical protein